MNTLRDNIIFYHNRGGAQAEFSNRHCHNSYEILFFVDGKADYVVENSRYALRPFDMLVIKPAQYHFLDFPVGKLFESFVINFPIKALPKELTLSIEDNRYLHLNENDDMSRMFFRLEDCNRRYDEDHRALMLQSIMTELLLGLNYAETQESEAMSVGPVLEKIVNYVNDNLTKDLDLEKIATSLNISPSHLSHLFNKAFGISIMQYIRQKKILYAQNLMQSGVRPAAAAMMCGFNNYATFYRAYKQMLGTIPSE